MKKTLAVAAVLAAFAASASADVTVYGSFDTGFHWQHKDGADTVQMKHSMNETSKFALKGSEKISENLTAGFKMEMALEADTGAAVDGAFQREMLGYLKTAYGEFGFGRTGSVGASTGSYAFLGSGNTGFGGGMGGVGDIGNVFLGKDSRLNNSVTYKSPVMGGVTLFGQVGSANANDQGGEWTHDVSRYYGVGAQYAAGALKAGLVATVTDYAQEAFMDDLTGADDALAVSGFVTYDFGPAKVYAAAQYFDGAKVALDDEDTDKDETCYGYEGYGLTMAVTAPVAGGTAKAIVGYGESEEKVTLKEYKNTMVGAAYVYPLSKQTGLYAAAGYTNKETVASKTHDEAFQALAGFYHNF